MPTVWRLLKVWSHNELPNRAPPLPEIAVHAIAGRALLQNDPQFALSVLVGFYGMMRTGEILEIKPSQIEVGHLNGPAVISLGMTKGGQRQGTAESITVTVFDVVRRLHQWKASSSSPLVVSSSVWRTKFSEALGALGLEDFQFRPYSLRRGGATFWFTKHGSLDRLLVQGRWQAAKTARIYINSGLAAAAEMKLPMHKLRGFLSVYKKSLDQSLPTLERTRKTSRPGGRGKRKVAKTFFLRMD